LRAQPKHDSPSIHDHCVANIYLKEAFKVPENVKVWSNSVLLRKALTISLKNVSAEIFETDMLNSKTIFVRSKNYTG
jgi:hypothetical protein